MGSVSIILNVNIMKGALFFLIPGFLYSKGNSEIIQIILARNGEIFKNIFDKLGELNVMRKYFYSGEIVNI